MLAVDLDDAAGRRTATSVIAGNGRAEFVQADVADEAAVRRTVDAALSTFGGLDIVVNSAGVVTHPPFPDASCAEWMRVIDVNLRGVMFSTHYAIDAMRDRGGGAIVNIASLAGIGIGEHPSPEYAATKAAVVRFSAALGPLADRLGIRVNCICPDWVDTPMSQRTRARMSAEERRFAVPSVMLDPRDIADAAVELIGDESLNGRVMCCWCGRPRSLLPLPEYD